VFVVEVVVSGDVGDGDSSLIGDDDFVFTTPTSFNNEVDGVVTIGDEDFSLPVAVGEDVFPFFPFGEDDGGLVFLVDDVFPLVLFFGFVDGDEEGETEVEVFDVVFSITDSLNVIFLCAFFVGGAGFFFVGDDALFLGVDGFLLEDEGELKFAIKLLASSPKEYSFRLLLLSALSSPCPRRLLLNISSSSPPTVSSSTNGMFIRFPPKSEFSRLPLSAIEVGERTVDEASPVEDSK